ncbi:hypothetical protein [Pseudomonas shirazensis]|uniref:hypothetical protein n=1 Tax=Pseudomonas shirazensis TaxID=2745494 RepID=UPI0039865C59
MPHLIDFDGLEQNLFILQHLTYGSKEFCTKNKINRDAEEFIDYEWWQYAGLLKSIASNTIIESAIKVRILQDFVKKESNDIDLTVLDKEACSNLSIGTVSKCNFTLTLRESCNKIVHATEAKMRWSNTSSSADALEYWNGIYVLWGENRGQEWQVELNIEAWCIAMIRFNREIQEKVDWIHISKYDE